MKTDTFGDAGSDGITVVTGTGNTTIVGGGAGDTITVTGLATDTQTFTGSVSAFVITAGAGAQTITDGVGASTITGGAGNDTITLAAADTAIDIVVFSAITDGVDTITNFEGSTGGDIIQIAGALKTSLRSDTAGVNGDAAANTNTGATYAIETAAIGVVAAAHNGTLTVAHLTTAGYAAVAVALEVAFVFGDAAGDTANVEIFAVESDTAGTFGVYAWLQSSATDITVDGTELTLLGIATGGLGAFAAGDIAIA